MDYILFVLLICQSDDGYNAHYGPTVLGHVTYRHHIHSADGTTVMLEQPIQYTILVKQVGTVL